MWKHANSVRLPDDMEKRGVYPEYFNGNEEEVEDLRPYS